VKRTTATVDDDKTVVLNPFHKLNNVHNTILYIGVPTPWRGSPEADGGGGDDDDDNVYVYGDTGGTGFIIFCSFRPFYKKPTL